MDMAKYRTVFIEESTEHLAEMSTALLELEKEPDSGEAIDVIFRMAHSIKGMAASLDYDSITEISHRLEDRMQEIRAVGSLGDPAELGRLFGGLECLEAMVAAIRDTGEPPPLDAAVAAMLAEPAGEPAPRAVAPPPSPPDAAKKKSLSPIL
jgi:two-component system chemotaxis sensor kinase CheA